MLPTSNTGSQPVNSLHVLDKDMKEVGVINEIARGESIYAACSVGKYVYFITYRQTDLLWQIYPIRHHQSFWVSLR